MKQRATADHAKPVTRTVKPSIESALTLEQVREAVEMAWTDATNLPDHIENGELCQHLGNAAACLDEMIEREGKRRR